MAPCLNPTIYRNVTFADFALRDLPTTPPEPSQSFADWCAEVSRLSLAEYCYDIYTEHADDEDWADFHRDGETAAEVVDWFAKKFDLTSISTWGRPRA